MPESLFDKVLSKYGTCDSYMDYGEVIHDSAPKAATFATYYVRPDLFRFEWKGSPSFHLILTCKGEKAVVSSGFGLDEPQEFESDKLEAINKCSRASATALAFLYKLLNQDQEGIDYNFLSYLPFKEELSEGNTVLFKSNSENEINTENLLVDSKSLTFTEREALFASSESQAKLNAAKYFQDSDPDLAATLRSEADELKNTGKLYIMKFLDVEFDSMTDELKKEKFGV